MKLYIAVLDEFPDHMTPTLVAHAMPGARSDLILNCPCSCLLRSSFSNLSWHAPSQRMLGGF